MIHTISATQETRDLGGAAERLARASRAAGFAMAEDPTPTEAPSQREGTARSAWRSIEEFLVRCGLRTLGRPSAAWQQ